MVARLAELTAVREAVRRPPAGPDPVARERGVAAALAAFEAGDEAAGNAAPAHRGEHGRRRNPVALGARRAAAGSRPPRSCWPSWAWASWPATGIPAATTPTTLPRGPPAAATTLAVAGSATVEEPEGGTAGQGAPRPSPGGIVDLGDVDSSEALAERARSALASGPRAPERGV